MEYPSVLAEYARVGRGGECAQLLLDRFGHVERLDECGDRLVGDVGVGAGQGLERLEIGRASCRERV